METGLTIAEDYALLWNDILADNVVELREIRHIQKWLSHRKPDYKEAFDLSQCCEKIMAQGEVMDGDAQRLYDCSFALLKAMGAKLG